MADLNNYPKTNVVLGKQYVYDVNTLSWVRMTQPIIDGDTVNVSFPGSMAVTGPLTDAELRASAVPVSGPLTDTQLRASAVPVSGPLTDAELRAADVKVTLDGESVPVTGTFWQATQPVSAASLPLPSGASTLAEQQTQTTALGAQSDAEASGNGSIIAILKRIRTLLGSALTVIMSKAGTSSVTSVSDTASSTTLLASNANRLGATIQNTSSAVLYVKFGTTATATDFTVRMEQYDYYEVPFWYSGRIDGIWASDPNDGAAKITELTA
jgi:hypothetical protein